MDIIAAPYIGDILLRRVKKKRPFQGIKAHTLKETGRRAERRTKNKQSQRRDYKGYKERMKDKNEGTF